MTYECGRSGLPGVPVRGIPVASSTPRSYERRTSDGGLLASAPDPVPPMNRDGSPLRTSDTKPLSPQDEVSTLAPGARTGLTGRARRSVPAKDSMAGYEQGLTARPSPPRTTPVRLKGLSTLVRGTRRRRCGRTQRETRPLRRLRARTPSRPQRRRPRARRPPSGGTRSTPPPAGS